MRGLASAPPQVTALESLFQILTERGIPFNAMMFHENTHRNRGIELTSVKDGLALLLDVFSTVFLVGVDVVTHDAIDQLPDHSRARVLGHRDQCGSDSDGGDRREESCSSRNHHTAAEVDPPCPLRLRLVVCLVRREPPPP